jgi:hypothetical protein
MHLKSHIIKFIINLWDLPLLVLKLPLSFVFLYATIYQFILKSKKKLENKLKTLSILKTKLLLIISKI